MPVVGSQVVTISGIDVLMVTRSRGTSILIQDDGAVVERDDSALRHDQPCAERTCELKVLAEYTGSRCTGYENAAVVEKGEAGKMRELPRTFSDPAEAGDESPIRPEDRNRRPPIREENPPVIEFQGAQCIDDVRIVGLSAPDRGGLDGAAGAALRQRMIPDRCPVTSAARQSQNDNDQPGSDVLKSRSRIPDAGRSYPL
jgi:hypothetical protein